MTVKEKLHRLVDELPEAEVTTALRVIEALHATADPLLRTLLSAPPEDEPISAGEEAAVAEARAAVARGEVISDADLRRDLGL